VSLDGDVEDGLEPVGVGPEDVIHRRVFAREVEGAVGVVGGHDDLPAGESLDVVGLREDGLVKQQREGNDGEEAEGGAHRREDQERGAHYLMYIQAPTRVSV
jgi:hypothetical protein